MRTIVLLLAIATIVPIVSGWLVHDRFHARRERLQTLITARTTALRAQAGAFEALCMSTTHMAPAERRQGYERLRSAYKAIEPFIEYLEPSLVTQHINGAPLPRLDVKSQFVDVLEPTGLQVIDDVLHSSDTVGPEHGERLRTLASTLRTSLDEACTLVERTPWTDRMLLEMCRSGILRVTAMGITGFDRPASDPTPTDDLPPLHTIRDVMELFRADCSAKGASTTLDTLVRCLRNAETRLQGASFDRLERADLVRTCLDPAYGLVAVIQQTLEIELSTEIGPQPVIVDPLARSMFATDVLEAAAASGMRAKDVTPELVELGRLLFFDPILSSTNDRSCASCHDPSRAFTDGFPRSIALGRNGMLDRNAPTLINAAHSRRFFHDLRAMRVSDVVAHVLTNEREFNTTLLDVVGRLRTSDDYMAMFARVFRMPASSAIDPTNIGLAISAYLTTLVSFDSRVDRYLRGENVTLSDAERRGFDLFMGKAACASCHFPPTFAGYVPPSFTESESEIIGVPLHRATERAVADPDPGRAGGIVRENAAIYRGSFKTPTVRNVALTAPYFHNGAYDRLEDVVDFYARGGGVGIGLDVPYQTLPFDTLDLTEQDQRDIVAFMKALTDTAGLTSRPLRLPRSSNATLNRRKVGGVY